MNCRVGDFRYKDVINVEDGCKLGCVCDVEIDTCNAKMLSIVIYGRYKFFGIFGREDDIVIPWCNIKVIGEDTILVRCQSLGCKNRGIFSFLSNLFR